MGVAAADYKIMQAVAVVAVVAQGVLETVLQPQLAQMVATPQSKVQHRVIVLVAVVVKVVQEAVPLQLREITQSMEAEVGVQAVIPQAQTERRLEVRYTVVEEEAQAGHAKVVTEASAVLGVNTIPQEAVRKAIMQLAVLEHQEISDAVMVGEAVEVRLVRLDSLVGQVECLGARVVAVVALTTGMVVATAVLAVEVK